MKTLNFVIFFSVFFTVYGLINYYIFSRGWQLLPPDSALRTPYLITFCFFALAFVAGRFLERAWLSPISEALVWIGSFWLAAMLYFFLLAVAADLLRLLNLLVTIIPERAALPAVRVWIFGGAIGAVALVVLAGHLNTLYPRVREVNVTVAKQLVGVDSVRIVAASDIHLGTIIGRRRLAGIVEKINGLHPDVILLPGDIVDEDLGPVIKENLGEMLRRLNAPYGVFAVTGNHEYIGGVNEAVAYLTAHGITLLRDSVARLDNGLLIVGREDRSIGQFTGGKRATLPEILRDKDTSGPVVVMDHQPFRLNEAVEAGVDLQLSGHTHHGQLWPLNYITNAVYEVSWGFKQLGTTSIYVSCGLGTWGPPVRLGNRPEIVVITLHSSP